MSQLLVDNECLFYFQVYEKGGDYDKCLIVVMPRSSEACYRYMVPE